MRTNQWQLITDQMHSLKTIFNYKWGQPNCIRTETNSFLVIIEYGVRLMKKKPFNCQLGNLLRNLFKFSAVGTLKLIKFCARQFVQSLDKRFDLLNVNRFLNSNSLSTFTRHTTDSNNF